jgi:hypothetical protein
VLRHLSKCRKLITQLKEPNTVPTLLVIENIPGSLIADCAFELACESLCFRAKVPQLFPGLGGWEPIRDPTSPVSVDLDLVFKPIPPGFF